MQDQDDDLIMNIQATTMTDITLNTSDNDDHVPWMGVTFPEEESGPVEINRMHNAVEMAHEYAKQHAKEEVTLPEEFKQHAALFSDEEAKKFPPSRPHDHKIELTPKAPNKFNCHSQVTMSFSHLGSGVFRQGYFPNRKSTRHLN